MRRDRCAAATCCASPSSRASPQGHLRQPHRTTAAQSQPLSDGLTNRAPPVRRYNATGSVKGTLDKFIVTLRKHLHGRPCRICFEASCDYGHLYDRLKKVAQQVVVAHPGKLRLIYADKRKNDKIDAFKLAKLLYAELVPQVHVPDEVVRSWRRTIELRTTLVHKRTRAKVSQRALLRGCGISMPKKLWSKKGLAWLSTVTLPTEADTLHRDMLLDELDHFERQIKRATRDLDGVGSQHPGVWLLRTTPGYQPPALDHGPPRRSWPTSIGRTASAATIKSARTSAWYLARISPPAVTV